MRVPLIGLSGERVAPTVRTCHLGLGMLMDQYESARTRGGLHPARNQYRSLFVTAGAFVGHPFRASAIAELTGCLGWLRLSE